VYSGSLGGSGCWPDCNELAGDLLDALTAHDIRFMRSDKPKAKFTGGFSKGTGAQWIDLELAC